MWFFIVAIEHEIMAEIILVANASQKQLQLVFVADRVSLHRVESFLFFEPDYGRLKGGLLACRVLYWRV